MSRPAIAAAPHRLKGRMRVGGQDHFYLEGQIAFAIPGEDDEVTVYSSTQHPSEVQHMVAHVLGVPSNAVTVDRPAHGRRLRRQGDAGRTCSPRVAAIAAKKLEPGGEDPARPRRRHDRDRQAPRFPRSTTRSASTTTAASSAVDGIFAARCGFSADLSGPVTDRALFHCRQRLFLPGGAGCVSKPLKTNTVSNTAFRGFGGPQGLIGAERIIEEIAYALGKDPLEIRKANFYGDDRPQRHALPPDGRGQHHRPHRRRAGGSRRTTQARRAGDRSPSTPTSRVIRKGIALTPVKFGISLHRHLVQPGRRAGACLQRRLDPPEPWRHRDGAGAPHQGGAGGGRRVPGRPRPGEDHRDDHRQGAEHLGDGGLVGLRPQRHGGAERRASRSRTG